MWKPSFFASGQANLLDANLLENRLRLCLNLHRVLWLLVSYLGPPTSSWNFHGVDPEQITCSWSLSQGGLLGPDSYQEPSWVQVRWCSFLFIFRTSNLEGEEWVFSNFITHDKNSVRWNLAWLHWPWFREIVLWLLRSWYAQGWALHGWGREDLASPRGLKFICPLGWMSFSWGLWARTGRSFAWARLPCLICGDRSVLFHVCCCSFQNECYSCISSLRILNIPIVKSICDCLKVLHFVESERIPLLLILLSMVLSVTFPCVCWSSSFLWACTERGVLFPFSLPSRSMVVSIWPNGTSHVALPSHAGITILSELFHTQELVLHQQPCLLPPRTAVAIPSGIPREWSQLVSHEAVGPSPILCGRMALSFHHHWGLGSSLFLGVESPSLMVLIWN